MQTAATSDRRDHYKSISPIWEDDHTPFGPTNVLLVHARSAFRDEDIVLTNNMPFVSDRWSFAFNGELRGVRVKAKGRTGAARIWNLIQRAHRTSGLSMSEAVTRTVAMLEKRSDYIRAVNILLTDGTRVILHSTFNESSDYFTLHQHAAADGNLIVTSSEPFDLSHAFQATDNISPQWQPVRNRTTLAW